MIRILQIGKRYSGNYSLYNEMVKLDPMRFQTVFCYLEGTEDGKNEMKDLVEKTIYLNIETNPKPLRFISLVRELACIIDQENIDVVTCQLEKTMPCGVMAALLSRKRPKVITIVHGLVGGNDYRISKKIKNLIFYKFLHRVVCVSRSIEDDVVRTNVKIDREKVISVQNGLIYGRFLIDLPREEARKRVFPDGDPNSFWFGTVGRLVEKKNHKNLIAAFRRVVDRNKNCLLLIAGDGPLLGSLMSQVGSLGLKENVFFLGKRKDVPEILKAIDVFAFPTYREGLPLALLEAMAAGLPVISSNISVVKEVFGDMNLGKLVDPDDPSAMAEAMIAMTEMSKQELFDIGHTAKRRALDDFSAARMARGYEEIYEEACRNRPHVR